MKANPSQEQVFDTEQTTGLRILQWFMGSRHGTSLITHGNGAVGEDPPKPIQS